MAANCLLKESNFCRLCGELNVNGIDLYTANEDSESLSTLVNKYLPLWVEDGDLFPRTICPACHIQLESTKIFLDLIIEGQEKLRGLLKAEQALLSRGEKERKKLEKALQNLNVNASVETYTIHSDEDREKYIIQIYSDGPLFLPDHELSLKTGPKPGKKKGRPYKGTVTKVPSKETEVLKESTDSTDNGCLGRGKRKIKAPTRFGDTVQGTELVNVLKKEGVLTEHDLQEDEVKQEVAREGSQTVIGMVISTKGNEHVEQPVYAPISRIKIRGDSTFTSDTGKGEFNDKATLDTHNENFILDEDIKTQEESTKNKERENLESVNNNMAEVGDEEQPYIEDGKKQTVCVECHKTFSCRQNLAVHYRAIHEGRKPFVCVICQKGFSYAISLKSHMVSHKTEVENIFPDVMYSCDPCQKVFNHKSALEYHRQVVHGNMRYFCNKCNRVFKHKQILLRHQVVHTEERHYDCEQCGSKFKTKANLSSHVKIHKGARTFVCSFCGKSFHHKSSLTVHIRGHEGEKPYKCNQCDKTFSQKGNCREHQRIHTGEKPFKCAECDAAFTTSSQYRLHKRIHSGLLPFGCKHCQRRFRHRKTYETHVRRHMGEKPFQCNFCVASFPDQWGRTRHERSHLGEKRYQCDICEKRFTSKPSLVAHKRRHMEKLNKPVQISKGDNCEYILPSITEQRTEQEGEIQASEEIADSTVNSTPMQIQNMLEEGRTINITTPEGEAISLVASGDDKFQGFLPDGTLVSFDIVAEQSDVQMQGNETSEVAAVSEVNLLNSPQIHFLQEDVIATAENNLNSETKVLFIENFDETAFLATG